MSISMIADSWPTPHMLSGVDGTHRGMARLSWRGGVL